jgi:hypothetical protein
MKIPTAPGVISVCGSQEEARRAERNTAVLNRQVHVIDEAEGNDVLSEVEQKVEACDNPPRKILYYRLNQSTLVIKR